MPKNNNTKYALLGILSLFPASGYDIKKFCDWSISHFWNENYGHIYPVLKLMEEGGLVVSQSERNEARPPRNVYFITEKGKEELDAWLRLPVEDHPVRSELLLKLFFARDIDAGNIIEKLEHKRMEQQAKLEEYERVGILLTTQEPYRSEQGLHLWLASISFGKHTSRAIIDWCEETIRSLQETG